VAYGLSPLFRTRRLRKLDLQTFIPRSYIPWVILILTVSTQIVGRGKLALQTALVGAIRACAKLTTGGAKGCVTARFFVS